MESILNQTFRDFEFLIVDDGSVDDSRAILQTYAERDSRIRLTSQSNQGLTKSLNLALQVALGEFIARFDADDVSLPQRLEQQVIALRSDPTLVLIGSEVELISDDGYLSVSVDMPLTTARYVRDFFSGMAARSRILPL